MSIKKIKLLILDLDGVITDGTVIISDENNEYKKFSYQDLDAITVLHKLGLEIAILTAEDTHIASLIAKRFNIKNLVLGAKNKEAALIELAKRLKISLSNICYLADGDRDAPALEMVGVGLAPENGTKKAKNSSMKTLKSSGGNGAIKEAVDFLYEKNLI
jgi:Low specificity phosphatase (HAD superfamily)